jgi:uncharacterized UBP type Zn finger protein
MMCLSGNIHNIHICPHYNKYIFRDAEGSQVWYEAIAVIEYMGRLSQNGESEGHYICDVKDTISNQWFRTNDNSTPFPLRTSDVSQNGYVVLLRRA